jgi:uncharacterized membrane protein
MRCPLHGQCCFNPNNPSSYNGYVCCGFGEQCVYEEGPTAAQCVSPYQHESSPQQSRPQPMPNSESRRSVPAPPQGSYAAHICNKSGVSKIWAAQNYHDVASGKWVTQGWWEIADGQCLTFQRSLGPYSSSSLSYSAQGGGFTWWRAGNADTSYCVQRRSAFKFLTPHTCPLADHLGFRTVKVRSGAVLTRRSLPPNTLQAAASPRMVSAQVGQAHC